MEAVTKTKTKTRDLVENFEKRQLRPISAYKLVKKFNYLEYEVDHVLSNEL